MNTLDFAEDHKKANRMDLGKTKNLLQAQFARKKYLKCVELALHLFNHPSEDPETRYYLAEGCYGIGRYDQAADLFLDGFHKFGSVELLAGASASKAATGDISTAVHLAGQAITVDPYCIRAWRSLATSHTFNQDDRWLTKAQRLARKQGTPAEFRRVMNYVLCKAMNDIGKWSRAWKHAERGATFARPQYDPAQLRAYVAGLERLGSYEFPEFPKTLHHLNAPIFIVGMPRSGTSLLESLLHQNFDVCAFGEVNTISECVTDSINHDPSLPTAAGIAAWMKAQTPQDLASRAHHYATELAARNLAAWQSPTIDKMPGNILSLPMISALFPNARVLRMRRDPLDTCVSCYLGEFSGGNNFTYDIDWLAEAHTLYQRAGDIGAKFLKHPIIEVEYETLVTDQNAEIGRIGTELGLLARPTPSPSYMCASRSSAQVRGPVSRKSVKRHLKYGSHVNPLRDSLEKFQTHISSTSQPA